MTPIPAHEFKPEPNTSYLVFCPEHGGWHVGEWWTAEVPAGRWVLAYDTNIDLVPSHVLPVPPDAMDPMGMLYWTWAAQMKPAGNA
jgi:hypothetical protein